MNRKHIIWMFEWCENKFGKSKFNEDFKIKISKAKDRYGVYMRDKNTIQVNVKAHKSLLELCDTVVHEYTHYLQDMSMYVEYFLKYNRNYDNHPYEVTANNRAKKWKKKLREDFKKEFGLSRIG